MWGEGVYGVDDPFTVADHRNVTVIDKNSEESSQPVAVS